MLSEEQIEKRKERIRIVIDTFLHYENISINELSQIINVSSSTIQRDLNDVEYISQIYGVKAAEILRIIKRKLSINKNNGLSRGGIASTTNNEPIRDENGKFTGNKRR